MDFSARKLPQTAALELRICPVESVQPFAPMIGPVYVLLKKNEKLISVKGPLDFFTPEELQKFRHYKNFYLPQFVDDVVPFREAAMQVRKIISWSPTKNGESVLPPAPYELSDAVLQVVGTLWGRGVVIEPFFAAIFAHELCAPLSPALALSIHDRNTVSYENALLRSGLAVFLAVHLGYCDLDFLKRLRNQVFQNGLQPQSVQLRGIASEVDDLATLVYDFTLKDPRKAIRGGMFGTAMGRASAKMAARLQRVRRMVDESKPAATIFGERGFVDG